MLATTKTMMDMVTMMLAGTKTIVRMMLTKTMVRMVVTKTMVRMMLTKTIVVKPK